MSATTDMTAAELFTALTLRPDVEFLQIKLGDLLDVVNKLPPGGKFIVNAELNNLRKKAGEVAK